MVFDYKKHCIDTIREYINKNEVYECYLFLLHNLDFVKNSGKKFKRISIEKAYNLIEQCDDKINNTDCENFKVKIVNTRNILTQYLSHFH